MANKLYEENDIQNIADAIRTKNGTTNTYTVSSMSSAIEDIFTGVDTSDATASESDIRIGKTAYVNGVKKTGDAVIQGYEMYYAESSNGVIPDLRSSKAGTTKIFGFGCFKSNLSKYADVKLYGNNIYTYYNTAYTLGYPFSYDGNVISYSFRQSNMEGGYTTYTFTSYNVKVCIVKEYT